MNRDIPYTPVLIVIANIDVMIVESTELAPVEEHVASTGAEDSTLQISTAEPGVVEFVVALVASEANIITNPEVPAMISVLTEPAAGLISAPS